MESFDQKYLIETFKKRIRSQNRKDILPMKLISSYLGRFKKWQEFINEFVLKIRFYITCSGNYVTLQDVNSVEIDSMGNVWLKYKENNELKSGPLYTKKFDFLCNSNNRYFKQLHVNYMKDIREITLDHDIPISILMNCLEFPFIHLFVKHYSNSNIKQNNIVSKENLLSDIKNLFDSCEIYVVHSKDNLQKSNTFYLCDNVLTCQFSNIKKKIDEVKKTQSKV